MTTTIELGSFPADVPQALSGPAPLLREGQPADAPAILRLIEQNMAAGHLLPRTLDDLARHATRFVVLEDAGSIIGCAELAPLSRAVAEVRSLVVDETWRSRGLGSRLIEDLGQRARLADFSVLCAFAHEPHPFVRLGFSIVPHVWFPEKIALDCTDCSKFRTCGQYALALPLTAAGFLPSMRRLREPLTPASTSRDGGGTTLPPVRLRVIA